jgi:hypothetical protein
MLNVSGYSLISRKLALALTIILGLAAWSAPLRAGPKEERERLRAESNAAAAKVLLEQIKLMQKKQEDVDATALMNAAEYLQPGCVTAQGSGVKPGQWKPPVYAAPTAPAQVYKQRSERDQAPRASDDKGDFKPEWDQMIQTLVQTPRFKRLMDADPSRMQGICTEFTGFQPEQKARFWSAWLEAIARTESGLKVRDAMEESFKANDGSNQVSAGLLSMSLDDHEKGCAFKTMEDVYDPLKNLECGLISMNVLWNQKGRPLTALKAAQRYWSVTRPENAEKYKEFRGHLKKALEKHQLSCAASAE